MTDFDVRATDAASGQVQAHARINTTAGPFVLRVTDSQGVEINARAFVRIETPEPRPPRPAPAAWNGNLRLTFDEERVGVELDTVPLLHITEVDYGYPEVREVSESRVQADGAIDRTRHFANRVVTMTGSIAIDWQARRGLPRQRQRVMNTLAPYLRPAARSWLYSRFDDGTTWRMLLRADQFTRPQIANVQDISMSWKSPTAVFESEFEGEEGITPQDIQWHARNLGNHPAEWMVQLWGPCHAPAIVNVTTGQEVNLVGLELERGEWAEINSREHTVTVAGESRWHTIDYVATDWWQLALGENQIRYRCGWWDAPAVAWFFWRHASLL